jgi:hypothetical protein
MKHFKSLTSIASDPKEAFNINVHAHALLHQLPN